MEQFYQMILQFIDVWGYPAIIVLMALENACLPVPSELVFGFAGYLVFLGRMNLTFAVSAGVVGGLLGSLLAYTVGFYGGRPFINKYGRYIFLSQHHVNLAQQWFDRYGVKAVFLVDCYLLYEHSFHYQPALRRLISKNSLYIRC